MFSDIGLELSRQTMSSWMLRSAQLLEPLYNYLKRILLAEPAIFADETPLKVIKAEKATSYMWVYCCGSDRPSETTNIVLYDYHNSRGAQCAIDFLDGYQGYMHVDGYKAYGLTEAKLVACLAHIRRKFVDAKKIHAKAKTKAKNNHQDKKTADLNIYTSLNSIHNDVLLIWRNCKAFYFRCNFHEFSVS